MCPKFSSGHRGQAASKALRSLGLISVAAPVVALRHLAGLLALDERLGNLRHSPQPVAASTRMLQRALPFFSLPNVLFALCVSLVVNLLDSEWIQKGKARCNILVDAATG